MHTRRVLLALLLPAAMAHAKPMTLDVPTLLDDALLIAEVRVLGIEPIAGAEPQCAKVRLQVTEDPTRIFRGCRWIGEVMEVTTPSDGGSQCSAWLGEQRQSESPVLVVISQERRIVLGGPGAEGGYAVRGWFDYNACWLRCDVPELVDSPADPKHGRGPQDPLPLRKKVVAARYESETLAFWGRVARFLTALPGLEEVTLANAVEGLGDRDVGTRNSAQALLVERGTTSIDSLRSALEHATDPERRRRLREILATHEAAAEAFDTAERIRKRGDALVLGALRAGLGALQGEERERVVAAIAAREAK